PPHAGLPNGHKRSGPLVLAEARFDQVALGDEQIALVRVGEARNSVVPREPPRLDHLVVVVREVPAHRAHQEVVDELVVPYALLDEPVVDRREALDDLDRESRLLPNLTQRCAIDRLGLLEMALRKRPPRRAAARDRDQDDAQAAAVAADDDATRSLVE